MRKVGSKMGSVYYASIDRDREDSMRNVMGSVAAAVLMLKNYGYSDEAIYEIIPMLVGVEIRADQAMVDKLEKIIVSIHGLEGSEEGFIRYLRDMKKRW